MHAYVHTQLARDAKNKVYSAHTHTHIIHACIRTYINTYVQLAKDAKDKGIEKVYSAHTHTHMHTHIHIYIRAACERCQRQRY